MKNMYGVYHRSTLKRSGAKWSSGYRNLKWTPGWFTPVLGLVGVLLVSLTAAAISARLVLKLKPAVVFAGR
jgi:hypothetical protein